MTGVADVVRTTRRAVWHAAAAMGALAALDALLYALLPRPLSRWLLPKLFPEWHANLRRAAMVHQHCPRPAVPDVRRTLALQGGGGCDGAERYSDYALAGTPRPARAKEASDACTTVADGSGAPRAPLRWGVLVPVTSRSAQAADAAGAADPSEEAFALLEANARRLVASVPPGRRAGTSVHLAIDAHDPVYDCVEGHARLKALFGELGTVDLGEPLPPGYQGALCWIWALLARRAVDTGAELLVLLGDDVEMLDGAWQKDVEECFAAVAAERGLPFGCACVAIRDLSYEVFPTFPVLHRWHLDAFGGELLPREFRNQHGDPYLYELYRRWGAARYTSHATLRNIIGGKSGARYAKEGGAAAQWSGRLLDSSIERLGRYLEMHAPGAARVPCIDVVVPTFRCNPIAIAKLTLLECGRDACVHTTIVVDDPNAPTMEDVRQLRSYATGRTVRIQVMAENAGASAARNVGLWQSWGDHAIFLDDDVTPRPGLLDAYLGATERYPGAAAYVGVTELPPPVTLVQHALAACRITYFYGVADTQHNPPWGVTANLCVPSRHNGVSFSSRFPKTGGGEDVDFCIRSKQQAAFGDCVAVPAARVLHPFWDKPLKQIAGWAKGDVLCLEALPHATFRAFPNWAEVALACALIGRLDLFALAAAVEVAMLAPRLWQHAAPRSIHGRLVAAIAGAGPPMLQDAVRLSSKLSRCKLSHVCMHFDWMNGAGHHVIEKQIDIASKGAAFALAAVCYSEASAGAVLPLASFAALVGAYYLWCVGQAGLRVLPSPPPLRLAADAATIGPRALELGTADVPFVVFGHQRTGSNLLCGYLFQHPEVVMHYEVFNDKAIYSADGVVRAATALRERDADPASFLSTVFSVGLRCVGFKVFPEHICRSEGSRELFERVLADPRVYKVILRRENRLAACVSCVRAAATGLYIGENIDHVKVHIEPHELQRWARRYDAYYAYVEERVVGQGARVTRVSYEELVAAPEAAVRRVYVALGVEPKAPNAGVCRAVPRQTSAPLRDAISNFEQLKHAFVGTDLEADFE